MAGKYHSGDIPHLEVNNNKITDIEDISNELAHTFSDNSSSHNYSVRFQSFRSQAETQHLRFKSKNNESYNNPFSTEELTDTISKAHDTAVGPDEIHYQMLKHLPNEALQTLFGALNAIWYSGNFPDSWCTSTVIPVPKTWQRQIGLIQLSPYCFNQLYMQNYGKDDQRQASMVFGTK